MGGRLLFVSAAAAFFVWPFVLNGFVVNGCDLPGPVTPGRVHILDPMLKMQVKLFFVCPFVGIPAGLQVQFRFSLRP